MALKVGDKIRFLNAQGGGVICKILGKDMVEVTDQDGFDIPTLARECVLVSDSEQEDRLAGGSRPALRPGHSQPKPAAQSKSSAQAKETLLIHQRPQTESFDADEAPVDADLVQAERPEGERLSVYLAFVPFDVKQLSATSFECYLINDSNYELAYTIASGKGSLVYRRAAGFIQANTKTFIQELAKDDLNDFAALTVQLIAFKRAKAYEPKEPVSLRLKPNLTRFYKLHSFVENDFFEKDALLLPVVKDDALQADFDIQPEALSQAMRQKQPVTAPLSKSSKVSTNPLEFDLHISALLNNVHGMSPVAILEFQVNKFNEIMQKHLEQKGAKLIFIHGKGDGVLRQKIVSELHRKYPKCTYQDASFQEYGFGATQVTIH